MIRITTQTVFTDKVGEKRDWKFDLENDQAHDLKDDWKRDMCSFFYGSRFNLEGYLKAVAKRQKRDKGYGGKGTLHHDGYDDRCLSTALISYTWSAYQPFLNWMKKKCDEYEVNFVDLVQCAKHYYQKANIPHSTVLLGEEDLYESIRAEIKEHGKQVFNSVEYKYNKFA